ncbi:PstS family phosphate ABC transporter substrate-binding protein [Natronococcus occultus]|uniref:Phosphate ABC transporter substrate-binding protein, PhoT family n=1 Tax=Natronococcus occultus SP4 TaxID=694430 RepID=L0JYM2_9EURY|nr:PstS family phosphate ABC transporter substrate-binding protein [Natronococcus occultus]AGB37209.1 phosphate ABC transporter substrate-binding protein, PhoT family [Natronococcus occultus SP4]
MGNDPRSGSDGAISRRHVLLGAASAGLVGTAGCLVRGQDSGLEGEIVVDGSDTLLPNSAAVARQFQWENNQVRVSVSGSGTGAGFQSLCRDEIHLADASREIYEDEEQLCEGNGVEWLELEVVMDGIAIMKNPDNDWCESLTTEELSALWESGSDVETWSDLREEWPDEEISFYGRDSASGTFDYFTEAVNGESGNIRSDYTGTADTNMIVRGVEGNPYAVGFGGAGFYYENEDDVDLIAIDDGDGPVEPTAETIEQETYTPLSRPMYVYVNLQELAREEFRDFMRFYLENTQETALDVGFYAIPDETREEQRELLEEYIGRYT